MLKYQTAGISFKNDLYLHKEELEERLDYVQKKWEDELLQFSLRPILKKLVEFKNSNYRRLRILELGAQKGEGFELLTHIPTIDSRLSFPAKYVFEEDLLDLYLGLELEYEFVEQANEIYRDKKKVRFIKHDYRQGLGLFKEVEAPFDIYWLNTNTTQSLSKTEFKNLLVQIVEHSQSGALIWMDLRGKYCITNNFAFGQAHTEGWAEGELLQFIEDLQEKTTKNIKLVKKFDRSVLIGDHEEPRPFGNWCKTTRLAVNSLFDPSTRTDLNKLLLKSELLPEYDTENPENQYFSELIRSWNLFIQYAMYRFENDVCPESIDGWISFSPTLQFGLMTFDRIIRDTEWIAYGDVRASIIEPHIAYVLRSLEFELQKGLGCGRYFNVLLQVS
jgi:hypothetical protein